MVNLCAGTRFYLKLSFSTNLLLAPQLENQSRPTIITRRILAGTAYVILDHSFLTTEIEKVILSADISKALGMDGFNVGLIRAC